MRSNAKKVIQRLKTKMDSIRREAPAILANEGQKVFNENFRAKRFDGDSWPEVQRRIPGTKAYKYPRKKFLSRRTNPILVGRTRRLKNAVNNAIRKATLKRIIWGVDVPYAYYHNYGIMQKQRQFMGVNLTLRKRLKAKFELLYRRRK